MQTRDQKYAATVYEQVTKIKKEEEKHYKRYGAMAHKLPVLIRTAGLAQALEFVNSRGKKEQKQLLNDLAITIEQQDTSALLNRARRSELSAYIRLTQQVMAALLWYKRFAQSVLGVDPSEATETTLEDEDEND